MPQTFRYGQVQRSAMNWPFFVAQKLNFFEEEALLIEPQIFTAAPDPVHKLLEGSLELINVIPDYAIRQMLQGAPLSLIANTNTRAEYRLMVQSGIQNFGQLRGKRIGVNDGWSAEGLILKKLLREKGLDSGSYQLLPSGPPPKRCESLKQGTLEATMVTEPFDFFLEKEGFRCLASSSEVVPHYPFTVCVIRREKELREEILKFLSSLKNAWSWLVQPANRQKAVDILCQSTDTAMEHSQSTYDLYCRPPSLPSFKPTQEGVQTFLELFFEDGRIPSLSLDAQGFIDERYFLSLESKLTSNVHF